MRSSPQLRLSAFLALQYCLPKQLLSRLVGVLARCRWRWFKNLLIGAFARAYRPEMSDAEFADPRAYADFNAFFTRALRAGARAQPAEANTIASPVDGCISQIGTLDGESLLQAKGHYYTLGALLAGREQWVRRLESGLAATIYLAPYNYHRIHMPLAGRLAAAWHVPGQRYSVNAATAMGLPGLYARNERVVCVFESAYGPFAVVLIGALFVGSMSTVWHERIESIGAGPRELPLPGDEQRLSLARGAELGRFNMGSTVILLLAPGLGRWHAAPAPGLALRVGAPLGMISLADGDGPASP